MKRRIIFEKIKEGLAEIFNVNEMTTEMLEDIANVSNINIERIKSFWDIVCGKRLSESAYPTFDEYKYLMIATANMSEKAKNFLETLRMEEEEMKKNGFVENYENLIN